MASYYVYSGAAGSADGTSWANAKTTLGAMLSASGAGDTIYVAHDHAESTAGPIALTSGGSVANPVKVICVNRAGTVPPVSADRLTTAQVATTGANSMTLTGSGTHYDGIKFLAGDSTNSASITLIHYDRGFLRLDNCSLQLRGTGPGGIIVLAGNSNAHGTLVELNNTPMSFSNVAQTIGIGSYFRWTNTPLALIGSAVPTILFSISAYGTGASVDCIGVDLSAAGSGKTLCGAANQSQASEFRFVDCKLNDSVTKSVVPTGPGSSAVDFVRSSATGNFAVFRHRMSGTLEHETTVVRTGGTGATDGTTPISWKIVTTASSSYSYPFDCPPIAIWNDAVGFGRLATIEGIWGGGAVPLDSEIWVEVEYLGNISSPQGSFVNDGTRDLLAVPANQSVSSVSWGGSTTKFKLEATFTAQQKGWVYCRVKCAKPSSTFYIDPLVTLL